MKAKVKVIFDRDEGECWLCGKEVIEYVEADHVIQKHWLSGWAEFSLPPGVGKDDPVNLCVAHRGCNNRRPKIYSRGREDDITEDMVKAFDKFNSNSEAYGLPFRWDWQAGVHGSWVDASVLEERWEAQADLLSEMVRANVESPELLAIAQTTYAEKEW